MSRVRALLLVTASGLAVPACQQLEGDCTPRRVGRMAAVRTVEGDVGRPASKVDGRTSVVEGLKSKV